MKVGVLFCALAGVALFLSACGASSSGAPSYSAVIAEATCGPPAPGPRPFLALSYPEPNSTAVPTTIGQVIFAGSLQGVTGNATLQMTTSAGATVPLGPPTAAPSPMPTPYAVPSGWSGNIPFMAFPVPTLSPSTTYNFQYTYTDSGGLPPTCTVQVTGPAGSFTTQ
jgi:hypothetical protein